MTNNETPTVAVLGDLTALFSARSQRRSINYEKLGEVLKVAMGVDGFDQNNWFTLFSPGNEGQVSFVNGLRELGWNVETKNPRDVRRGMQTKDYRFNSRITYKLGIAAHDADRVLVVSDDYDLVDTIQDLQKDDPEVEVTLAFFGSALDGRWHKFLGSSDCPVNFIDLDDELYKE